MTKIIYLPRLELIEDSNCLQAREIEILIRSLISQFEQYVKLNKKIPPEILVSLAGIEEPGRLADTIAAHLTLKSSKKNKKF